MPDELDSYLQHAAIEPPDDFVRSVMQQIVLLPVSPLTVPTRRTNGKVEWFALAASVVAGSVQLAAFMFGIWRATAAG